MVVLVYVDDMLLDGYEQDINIFLDEWHKRFETTDAEWLTDDNLKTVIDGGYYSQELMGWQASQWHSLQHGYRQLQPAGLAIAG